MVPSIKRFRVALFQREEPGIKDDVQGFRTMRGLRGKHRWNSHSYWHPAEPGAPGSGRHVSTLNLDYHFNH